MAGQHSLGREGEDAALEYMLSKGYSLIDRNRRIGRFELDLVLGRGRQIIVVEVKTRSVDIEDMNEVIGREKLGNIREGAHRYMSAMKGDLDCRVDILFLEKNEDSFIVTHIEDAIGQ